jgi:hypothetical protein
MHIFTIEIRENIYHQTQKNYTIFRHLKSTPLDSPLDTFAMTEDPYLYMPKSVALTDF